MTDNTLESAKWINKQLHALKSAFEIQFPNEVMIMGVYTTRGLGKSDEKADMGIHATRASSVDFHQAIFNWTNLMHTHLRNSTPPPPINPPPGTWTLD